MCIRDRSKEITWAKDIATALAEAKKSDKAVNLVFVDEENKRITPKFLKALTDRWIAKHHDKMVFVKLNFDPKSDVCREWKVLGSPAMILVDPNTEDKVKRILGKHLSRTSVRDVRKSIVKALTVLTKRQKK